MYLCNAFSINMLVDRFIRLENQKAAPFELIHIQKLWGDEVRKLLKQGFVSAIGHESTAKLISKIFNVDVPVNRIPVKLERGDRLIVVQLTERLPEGKVLSDEEIQEFYKSGKVQFFLVEIADCPYCSDCGSPCAHKVGYFL